MDVDKKVFWMYDGSDWNQISVREYLGGLAANRQRDEEAARMAPSAECRWRNAELRAEEEGRRKTVLRGLFL